MNNYSLEIADNTKKDVLSIVDKFKNLKSRKRSYASLIGIYTLEKFLKDNNINLDKSGCFSSNPVMLESFDVADIKVNNLKIDVRIVTGSDTSKIYIPRTHQTYNFTPDIYVGVKLDSNVTEAEIVGFIEADSIKDSSDNKNYIIFESAELKPISELTDVCNSLNVSPKQFFPQDHEKAKELFLSYIDNEISNIEQEYLIRHLSNCEECIKDFNVLCNLNQVFVQVSKNEEIKSVVVLSQQEQQIESPEELEPEIESLEPIESQTNEDNPSDKNNDLLQDALVAGTAAAITGATVAATGAMAANAINNAATETLVSNVSKVTNAVGFFGKIKSLFAKKDDSVPISVATDKISNLTKEINQIDTQEPAYQEDDILDNNKNFDNNETESELKLENDNSDNKPEEPDNDDIDKYIDDYFEDINADETKQNVEQNKDTLDDYLENISDDESEQDIEQDKDTLDDYFENLNEDDSEQDVEHNKDTLDDYLEDLGEDESKQEIKQEEDTLTDYFENIDEDEPEQEIKQEESPLTDYFEDINEDEPEQEIKQEDYSLTDYFEDLNEDKSEQEIKQEEDTLVDYFKNIDENADGQLELEDNTDNNLEKFSIDLEEESSEQDKEVLSDYFEEPEINLEELSDNKSAEELNKEEKEDTNNAASVSSTEMSEIADEEVIDISTLYKLIDKSGIQEENKEDSADNTDPTKQESITAESSYLSNFVKPESSDNNYEQPAKNENDPANAQQTSDLDNVTKENQEQELQANKDLLDDVDNVEVVGKLDNIDVETKPGSDSETIVHFNIIKKEVNPIKIAVAVVLATSVSLAGYAYWKHTFILANDKPDPSMFKTQANKDIAQLPPESNNKIIDKKPAPQNTQKPPAKPKPKPIKPYVKKANKIDSNNFNDDIARAIAAQSGPVKITGISWQISASLASNPVLKNYLMVTGQALKSALATDLTLATDRVTNNVVKVQILLDPQGNIIDSKIQISSGSGQVDKIVLQTLKNTLNYTKLPYIQTNKKQIKVGLIVNL